MILNPIDSKNMTQNKTYPSDITDEVNKIAVGLTTLFNAQQNNLRTIAKFASISVNSVKSVLAGKTGNIASYSLVAKALGTNLIDVIYNIKMNELKGASAITPTLQNTK